MNGKFLVFRFRYAVTVSRRMAPTYKNTLTWLLMEKYRGERTFLYFSYCCLQLKTNYFYRHDIPFEGFLSRKTGVLYMFVKGFWGENRCNTRFKTALLWRCGQPFNSEQNKGCVFCIYSVQNLRKNIQILEVKTNNVTTQLTLKSQTQHINRDRTISDRFRMYFISMSA